MLRPCPRRAWRTRYPLTVGRGLVPYPWCQKEKARAPLAFTDLFMDEQRIILKACGREVLVRDGVD